MVSACAGSGKTWLLVARLVRILLAGAKPHQILALTFTRKAAQEMRERLYGLLEEFARSDDSALITALVERGLNDAEARIARIPGHLVDSTQIPFHASGQTP